MVIAIDVQAMFEPMLSPFVTESAHWHVGKSAQERLNLKRIKAKSTPADGIFPITMNRSLTIVDERSRAVRAGAASAMGVVVVQGIRS